MPFFHPSASVAVERRLPPPRPFRVSIFVTEFYLVLVGNVQGRVAPPSRSNDHEMGSAFVTVLFTPAPNCNRIKLEKKTV